MKSISIDIETFSSVDLSKSGVYRYAEAPDFKVLIFGYSADGCPVEVIDLAHGQEIPDGIISALTDPSVVKWAFNASFERVCLSRLLGLPHGTYLDPDQWRCSMVWAATLGLPQSLEGAGSVLGLPKQKLAEGKALIRRYCLPGKKSASLYDPQWERFIEYNRRDVEAEMAIKERLSKFPVPEWMWEQYRLDQEINDRGVLLDMELVRQAIIMDEKSRAKLMDAMKIMTSMDNPNSAAQMKQWLSMNGVEAETLGRKAVEEMLKTAPEELREPLRLRLQLAKSSVKKYAAMRNAVCSDGRARGMFRFCGASRTARWSGKLIQMQNLRRNDMPDLAEARALVRSGDYGMADMLYGDVPDVLSQLVRTAFIAPPGKKLIVADFSAIEARVLAWLAGEKWRMDLFARGGDIYCQSASQMFKVPVVKHGVNGHLRQKGKIAELACIAKGQMVLTDRGLVPIQDVEPWHRLWDGEAWVSHGGVVPKGEGKVLTYEGLSATSDHMVWACGSNEPVMFGTAASSGMHLARTGQGAMPVKLRLGDADAGQCRISISVSKLYDIIGAGPRHRFTVSGRLVHNCGYGGSVGALKAMGALEMGLAEDELPGLVSSWRDANPAIVKFWRDVDDAVKLAVGEKISSSVRGIGFECRSGMLFITPPSGRKLAYPRPRIGENRFGGESVTYEGSGLSKKWERLESYGPKFVENIVQAVSRDLLAEAMLRLKDRRIVMHVHDEVVIEADTDDSLEEVCRVMAETPPWADGLLLRADGYETDFYRKD